MKTVSLGLVSVLSTGLALFLLSTIQVAAQPLIMNSPTGSMTDGANISINPVEPLPANGTVSISTEGVADTDMNVIPPEGVTVIIENDTVTITNQAVDIETAEDNTGDGGSGDGGSGDGGSGDGGAEMVAAERKIHQKKENKIPYFLFVSRLHELTKATQFFDLFGEDSDFNEGPPSQPSPEPEFENSSFFPEPQPEISNGSYLTPIPTPTDYSYWTHTEELRKACANITSR